MASPFVPCQLALALYWGNIQGLLPLCVGPFLFVVAYNGAPYLSGYLFHLDGTPDPGFLLTKLQPVSGSAQRQNARVLERPDNPQPTTHPSSHPTNQQPLSVLVSPYLTLFATRFRRPITAGRAALIVAIGYCRGNCSSGD
ncbi:hypothetical protein F5Y07DRAFT_116547 [Xylaria sp. FL0933]|nr:hypothetical protein F5Y07DRAFT_116547 [Xylaria sp. FL0933]